jgi:hypothetical protein
VTGVEVVLRLEGLIGGKALLAGKLEGLGEAGSFVVRRADDAYLSLLDELLVGL